MSETGTKAVELTEEEKKKFEESLDFVNLRDTYDEALLTRFYKGLMKTNFPIEDELEPLDVWIGKLSPEKAKDLHPKTYILNVTLAMIKDTEDKQVDTKAKDRRIISGGIAFEYYKASNCGLITYFVVDPNYRRQGVVKLLVDRARKTLNELAKANGKDHVELIFAETNATGVEDGVMPSTVRHKIMQRLGMAHLDFPYVQPPLDEGLEPCYDMLLIAHSSSPAITTVKKTDGKTQLSVPAKTVLAFWVEFAHSCHGVETDPSEFTGEKYYKHAISQFDKLETIVVNPELPWPGPSPKPAGVESKHGGNHAPKHIIIAGPPAAGKGTQCEYLKEKYGVVHISTGDLLRENVKKGTEIGKKAKEYMDAGKLVPDEIMIDIVKENLNTSEVKEKGWLLDGFPRTKDQAEALAKAGVVPHNFIVIEVPDEQLIERVEGRRLDPETGKIYHLKFSPPPNDEKVKARLVHRSDDSADKLKSRLVEYHKHIAAVEGYFKSVLAKIDGTKGKENVSTAITSEIDKAKKQDQKKAKHIIIAGPPAAGKGTQCEHLKEKYGVVHISTGDLLRENVKKGTEIGKKAKEYMDAGKLVPDEIMIDIVKENLNTSEVKEKGWLLDGFPRTKEQAEALAKAGIVPHNFIVIEVPDDQLIERVEGRRLDPETGKIYHLKFSPPPNDEKVKERLIHRSDDSADKLKSRLVEYHKHIAAVEGYFKNVLAKIDGTKGKDSVSHAITSEIEKTH